MRFDRIEIHFKTKGGQDRTVIIDQGSKVDGIILNSTKARQKDIPEIDGMKLVGGDVDPGDGPRVCYDAGGSLQCW